MRPRLALLAALLACATLAVGCGGKSGSPYGEANAKRIDAATVAVNMKDLHFAPKGIKVKTGTTVTWTNDDSVVHNVRQVKSVFLSPTEMLPGETFSFKFDKPGIYRYQCTFHHPSMDGVLIVEAG